MALCAAAPARYAGAAIGWAHAIVSERLDRRCDGAGDHCAGARRVRGLRETPRAKLLKDLAHFSLLAAALPFTLLEAAFHAGSTIMIEARKTR